MMRGGRHGSRVGGCLALVTLCVLAGEVPPHAQTGASPELKAIVQAARLDIDAFWRSQVTNYRPPLDVVMVQAPAQTDCGAFPKPNARYCSSTNKIYWDLRLFADGLRIGNFALVFILAHEWGHLVQGQMGFTSTAAGLMPVQLELQADCFAGTYAANLRQRGKLDEGDDDEAALTLRRTGDGLDDSWFDRDAHGTSGQRIDAFTYGFEGRSCTAEAFFTFLKNRGIDPSRVPQVAMPATGSLSELLPHLAGRFTLTAVKREQMTGATDVLSGTYRSNDGIGVQFTMLALPSDEDARNVRDKLIEQFTKRSYKEVRQLEVTQQGARVGLATVLQGQFEFVIWSNRQVVVQLGGPANVTFELFNALPF